MFVCLSLMTTIVQAESLVPRFTTPDSSTYVATEGKVALVWAVDGDSEPTRFELQQSDENDFTVLKTRYQGLDRGTYISGLSEGDYFFRVRVLGEEGEAGAWSETMEVQVRYVSHTLVFWLMSIGALVFLATVYTVIKGHFREVKKSDAVS